MNQQGRFLTSLEIDNIYPANEVYDYLKRGDQSYIGTNFNSIVDLDRSGSNIDNVKIVDIVNGWHRFENGTHVTGHENSRVYFLEKQ